MGTTADKLNRILQTKEAIKQSIIGKGVEVADLDTFATYPEKISAIETSGGSNTYEALNCLGYVPQKNEKILLVPNAQQLIVGDRMRCQYGMANTFSPRTLAIYSNDLSFYAVSNDGSRKFLAYDGITLQNADDGFRSLGYNSFFPCTQLTGSKIDVIFNAFGFTRIDLTNMIEDERYNCFPLDEHIMVGNSTSTGFSFYELDEYGKVGELITTISLWNFQAKSANVAIVRDTKDFLLKRGSELDYYKWNPTEKTYTKVGTTKDLYSNSTLSTVSYDGNLIVVGEYDGGRYATAYYLDKATNTYKLVSDPLLKSHKGLDLLHNVIYSSNGNNLTKTEYLGDGKFKSTEIDLSGTPTAIGSEFIYVSGNGRYIFMKDAPDYGTIVRPYNDDPSYYATKPTQIEWEENAKIGYVISADKDKITATLSTGFDSKTLVSTLNLPERNI